MLKTLGKSAVALVCIFATLSASASSTSLAAEATSQATVIANDLYEAKVPSAERVEDLAATMDAYIEASDEDGSLSKRESVFLRGADGLLDKSREAAHVKAAYERRRAHGWKGIESDVADQFAAYDMADRKAMIARVRAHGLKALLKGMSSKLHKLAGEIATTSRPSLFYYAAYDFNGAKLIQVNWQEYAVALCNLEGEFKAVTAIGAVAALGGVDPLGDLLLGIGAVGEFASWASCSINTA